MKTRGKLNYEGIGNTISYQTDATAIIEHVDWFFYSFKGGNSPHFCSSVLGPGGKETKHTDIGSTRPLAYINSVKGEKGKVKLGVEIVIWSVTKLMPKQVVCPEGGGAFRAEAPYPLQIKKKKKKKKRIV